MSTKYRYEHHLMGRSYPRMQLVTIEEIIEQKKRLDILMGLEVVKQAQRIQQREAEQPELGFGSLLPVVRTCAFSLHHGEMVTATDEYVTSLLYW